MSRPVRADYVEKPPPLIVPHPVAAAMLSIEPADLRKAGDLNHVAYHTHSLADVKPHRYYLVADLTRLAEKIREAGCLEKLLTSSLGASTPKPAKPSRTGTKTPRSKGQTANVLDFERALEQTIIKRPEA